MKGYDVVKKDLHNAKIKNIEHITNIATNTTLNTTVNEVQDEIISITNLATTAALTTIENKIPNVSNSVKNDYNTKISEIKKKIIDHDHDKYITPPEFNKWTAERFSVRFTLANLASKIDIANLVKKTDLDDKLLSFNKRINSNKTKHVLVENKLNELPKKVEAVST